MDVWAISILNVRKLLGDELLAQLCDISVVSLRRYSSGSRETPDAVAQRLHLVALILGDLRGAYNDYGIRRWFQRSRPQLEDRSPMEALSGPWVIDSPPVVAVRTLARALSGLPVP